MTKAASRENPSEGVVAPRSQTASFGEVVDGEIVELPDMSIFAYVIALRLRDALSAYAETHRRGVAAHEWVFVLDAARPLKRKPDAAFVSFDRWPEDREIPEQGDWQVVPDLAIEVISPSDLNRDVSQKVREYFRYGVRQVWIIQPEARQVLVYLSPKSIEVFDRDDVLDGGDILPGFRMPVAELFRRTVGR